MLLQVHAKQCQNNDCPVPRCRELREMRRRAVVRQEDQRRVAYQAMLRAQNGQVLTLDRPAQCITVYSTPPFQPRITSACMGNVDASIPTAVIM